MEQAQQLTAATCLLLATAVTACLQKHAAATVQATVPTVRLSLHVPKILHVLLTLIQNLKGKIPLLQGDAGVGCASDNASRWLFATKFPLQFALGRILAHVTSGTSLCYSFQKSLELGWLTVAALNKRTCFPAEGDLLRGRSQDANHTVNKDQTADCRSPDAWVEANCTAFFHSGCFFTTNFVPIHFHPGSASAFTCAVGAACPIGGKRLYCGKGHLLLPREHATNIHSGSLDKRAATKNNHADKV